MGPHPRPFTVDIWHNILWSQYKGEVFSSVWEMADRAEFNIRFFQIAETDGKRIAISAVDLSRHRYPHELLFKGRIDELRLHQRLSAILPRTLRSEADLTVLIGYEKIEYWLQLLILLLKRKKIALFLDSTIHDQKQKFLTGILKTSFFKAVDGVFAYGTRTREYTTHYGADPDKIFTPCQAIALPLNYEPEAVLRARVAAPISTDSPRFLYVGRLSGEKGLMTLLEAFARIRSRFRQAKLVIVGSGVLRESLETKAKYLDIGEAVEFTGSKSGDALYREFTLATALILPSTSEPWGLVVNEALSYGCPVIVSDRCGCVPEMVIEGKTGFVHIAGNVDNLADKMLSAPAQFADIEATARACLTLMTQYTPERAANQIISGCREILSRTSR